MRIHMAQNNIHQSKKKATSNKRMGTQGKIPEEELKKLWDFLNPKACKKRAEAAEKFARELCRQFTILNGIKSNEKDTRNT